MVAAGAARCATRRWQRADGSRSSMGPLRPPRNQVERLPFDGTLELARASVDEHPAEDIDERAPNHDSEHPAEVDVERVGRAGAAVAEVLELPAAVDRLEVALLLAPAQARRSVVEEAHVRLDRSDLPVRVRLAQRGAAVGVALQHVDVL